jgi:hypothetical protein
VADSKPTSTQHFGNRLCSIPQFSNQSKSNIESKEKHHDIFAEGGVGKIPHTEDMHKPDLHELIKPHNPMSHL